MLTRVHTPPASFIVAGLACCAISLQILAPSMFATAFHSSPEATASSLGPYGPDPLDLNHREATASRERQWAAMKADREAREAEQGRQEVEAARRAAEGSGVPASRQVQSASASSLPVPPRPPAPQEDGWMAVFNEMVAHLPGYYVVSDQGTWGATDLDSGTVYIARRTPLANLRSVMLHEAAHVLQGRTFGGYDAAVEALAPYGGIEPTADCKALAMGATWVHYGCTASARKGAALF